MTISEIKDTAKKTLSGKMVNVYIITSLYTLVCFAIQFISRQVTSNQNLLTTIISIVLSIIQLFFGYGLISNLIQISKQHEPMPYTQFMTDAVLNASKVLKLIINLFFKMLIPIILFSIVLGCEAYFLNLSAQNPSYKIPLIITLILFIISFVGLISYALNFVLSLFCLVDNNDKTAKENTNKSKTLMKGNKLKYIGLSLSFIGFYILIGLISYILGYFLDEFFLQIASTILSMLLTPYITISQYIFYEELLPIEKINNL